MKIPALCSKCMKEKIPCGIFGVNYKNDLTYDTECPNQHKIHGIIHAPKFELFLTCGAEALIREYPVEACFNFTLARENLFIYAIRVMLGDKFNDDYKKTFTKLSERILGGFGSLYTLNFNSTFDIEKRMSFKKLGTKEKQTIINFRNDIVHKGTIPSLEEASEYGQIIYNETKEIIESLTTKFKIGFFVPFATDSSSTHESLSEVNNNDYSRTDITPFLIFNSHEYIFSKTLPDSAANLYAYDSFYSRLDKLKEKLI